MSLWRKIAPRGRDQTQAGPTQRQQAGATVRATREARATEAKAIRAEHRTEMQKSIHEVDHEDVEEDQQGPNVKPAAAAARPLTTDDLLAIIWCACWQMMGDPAEFELEVEETDN